MPLLIVFFLTSLATAFLLIFHVTLVVFLAFLTVIFFLLPTSTFTFLLLSLIFFAANVALLLKLFGHDDLKQNVQNVSAHLASGKAFETLQNLTKY